MSLGKTPCGCGRPLHRGSPRCNVCRLAAQSPKRSSISDSIAINGNTCEITKGSPHRVRTLEQLIAVCEIDTSTWSVDRFICNKWEMGSVNRKTGGSVVTELYQIKVWLTRKVALQAIQNELDGLVRAAKKQIAPRPLSHRRNASTGTCLEIGLPDLHAGKMAWADETGHEHYDTKIAVRLFETALDTLLDRTAGHSFDRVILTLGNDLLNADNTANTTTAGTAQECDGRFQKTFVTVREMAVRAIERCRRIAPVYVPMVPGNHDTLSSWHLGDSLACYFHNTTDVVIDNAPTSRKYFHYGSVMLMWTHGDKGKATNYPLLMATEQPAMFGATLHREAHIGHIHQTRVTEQMGVRVRTISALCPPDAWHSANHYVGNARAAEAFVWDASEGMIATAIYTVPPERSTT